MAGASFLRLSCFCLAALLATAAAVHAADVTIELDGGDGFSIRNSGGAIERIRIDEATGNVSRNGALFVHTTGIDSVFVGEGAGDPGSDPYYGENTAVGVNALTSVYYGFKNTAVGSNALRSNADGFFNSAFGSDALRNNTEFENAAFGSYAMESSTTGINNAAFGHYALRSNVDGGFNSAFGVRALANGSTGSNNAAFGHYALYYNTADGNSAFGYGALGQNTTGIQNTAVGRDALEANTTGINNVAIGPDALSGNLSGGGNVAVGPLALAVSTQARNTAVGFAALDELASGSFNVGIGANSMNNVTSGSSNVSVGDGSLGNLTSGVANLAVGDLAGLSLQTGSNNIYIRNGGVANESNTIRIGTTHTQTFIDGIFGATSAGGAQVFVNSSNQLGTITSSARFKRDIEDLGSRSDVLMRLRPVAFHYREEVAGSDADLEQYGLVAEEVASVAPGLVVYDEDGAPYSVRYQLLAPLLLGQVQQQQRTIDELRARVRELEEEREGTAGGR